MCIAWEGQGRRQRRPQPQHTATSFLVKCSQREKVSVKFFFAMEGRTNLSDLVGKWLEEVSALVVWKREMHIMEIASRCIFMFDTFVGEIRRAFPCNCVLPPRVKACVYCYIDVRPPSNAVALQIIKAATKATFLTFLKTWPEFLADVSHTNFFVPNTHRYPSRFM
jgi:hypothetical protein